MLPEGGSRRQNQSATHFPHHRAGSRGRRVLRVEFRTAFDCLVGGPGAGALIKDVTGRPAVYSRFRNGYAVQERTARSIIATAEHLGYDIEILGSRGSPTSDRDVVDVEELHEADLHRAAPTDPAGGLW